MVKISILGIEPCMALDTSLLCTFISTEPKVYKQVDRFYVNGKLLVLSCRYSMKRLKVG